MSQVSHAAEVLRLGGLVAFPTETVYGLGADATNPSAIARIYQVKGRPSDHPLIVHIASAAALKHWASNVPQYAFALAQRFWPGPMTMIFERTSLSGDFITGGQPTVGLRVPNHETALELLALFERAGGLGVAAPSANRFGRVSPTSYEHVRSELADHLHQSDLILDGAVPTVGIESTIIDCTGPTPAILRPGFVTAAMIEQTTGLSISNSLSAPRVSGSMKSHYAPLARVELDLQPRPGDGLIALADFKTPEGVTRLCAPENLSEYASNLYSALHRADDLGLTRVVAITPAGDGLAIAIRDRLQKASHR